MGDFETVPINASILLPEDKRHFYYAEFCVLPKNLQSVAGNLRTGSYIKGLMKNYGLQEPMGKQIALSLLPVIFGEKTLAQLASLLSTNAKLPNDKAQKMATEIERDLFAPVMLELNQYATSRKNQVGSNTASAQASGAHNILDLKNQTQRPPVPPPIPRG